MRERPYISRGSATPIPQGGGSPALNNFTGSLLFMRTCFDAELPNLTWYRNTYMGSEGSVTPPTQGAGSQRSPILGFLLFMRKPFVAELPNLTW